MALGVPADHSTRHRHPRRCIHRARRDSDCGDGTHHVLRGPLQEHSLPEPFPRSDRSQGSHGDSRAGKRARCPVSGRPLNCGISHRISSDTPQGGGMSASAGAANTAYRELGSAILSGATEAKAAIVIVSQESGTREILHREMSKRYSADYQIVVCGQPPELVALMRSLRAAGRPVALVIGGVGEQDPDGIEVLAAIRDIDPAALRVAAVGWGDWQSVRSVFTAVTLGTLNHWVICPAQAPAEEFHRSIAEFLREWGSQRGGGFEVAQVIGEHWSARSQELRDLFSRYRVPAGFYDAASEHGRQMLRDLGLESAELPVVVLRFAAKRSILVNPSNQQIADAFGVMTPIPPGEVFDVAVVGGGPAGLAAAVG